jgi:uncharacterized protein YjbI with pentapeptide repeats
MCARADSFPFVLLLREADLSGADLSGANLNGANLSGARLIESKVTVEQLATAMSLNGATFRWINGRLC